MRSYAKVIMIAAAAAALIAGLAIDRRSTLAAYLVAWVAIGAIPLGALCTLMTSYLVRRAWTEGLHSILVAATSVLPVVGLLSLPILIGIKELYPAASDGHSLPAFKALYLAPWFFVLRMVVYFVMFWLLALWQRATWSASDRMMRSASVGLIVYALLVSFAGIDWIESLEPEFHSSIYGLLYLCFVLLDGIAFGIGIGLFSRRWIGGTRGYSALLLSTILLWGYLHAMQYIVIWAGNIPDEAVWYLKRSSDGWQFVLAFVALGQFVFPFFALLSARVRSDRSWLLALCGLTLVMRCWEASILILPAVPHIAPVFVSLMLVAALVLVAAILWWAFEVALTRDGRLLRPAGRGTRAAE
ncbi:MAG: hypothetical protein JOY90_07835 [Bradyrhizobium sp.]|uniref:hypothetical protein n=1 Tax=Bradyrhizobium sp. TaxID=376 RepID=UPI001E186BB0|nr:hypothetical protein [Bradyrhizobium sp.]MBV9560355.1 hypothetical protein [Bradyrhizobium sp.]